MTGDGVTLRRAAEEWLVGDPDPRTRAEVQAMLDADDEDGLRAGFERPLAFGTAGLRGPLGPGPARMNRAVVRRTAAGLCRWLDRRADTGPVVVGGDSRHGSAVFVRDIAGVVAGTGRSVILIERAVPTPLVAFAVLEVGAGAGIMVTASHNPAGDNGCKIYAGDGAQIAPPMDGEIADEIDAVGPAADIPMADPSRGRPSAVAGGTSAPGWEHVVDRYLDAVASVRVAPDAAPVTVAYTPLHGVGGELVRAAFDRSGLAPPEVVVEQADPDPEFPTVGYPNPEETGAMDLVLALGTRLDADLVLANDPDADRLGVAVPDLTSGGERIGWRSLTGDEVGVLLADHLLRHTDGPDRLVLTTIVSSSMLASVARSHGVHHEVTLTGFKWLARAAMAQPSLRLVLAYEEALGYCIGSRVRDKDGIAAAVVMTELTADLAARGTTVPRRLAELAVAHGLHRTRQHSWRAGTGPDTRSVQDLVDTMHRLRHRPPSTLGPVAITSRTDLAVPGGALPATDALVLAGDGVRVTLRPSGTEPKLKCYVEVVRAVDTVDAVPETAAAADAIIDGIVHDLGALL